MQLNPIAIEDFNCCFGFCWGFCSFHSRAHAPPRMIKQSQSRSLRESLLIGLAAIGFLYFATDGLLWLEGYVRDQFMNAGSISG